VRFDGTTSEMEWREGFPLSLSATAEGTALADHTHLITSGGLGTFGPLGRQWQFEPGLAVELEPVGIWLTCSGFEIRFRDSVSFQMLYLGDGVWRGRAPEKLVPDLFSTHFETEEAEGTRSIEAGSEQVALAHRLVDGRRELALVRSTSLSKQELNANVQDVLAQGDLLSPAWQNLLDTRKAWAEALPETEEVDAPMFALEHLIGHTRISPDGASAWVYDGDTPLPAHLLPSVLEALLAGGASRVIKVLENLKTSLASGISWPVLAQGLQRLSLPSGSEDLVASLTSSCEEQVRTFLKGWQPGSEPLPAWPVPETSFTPEITGGDLTQFDLPALLIAEMDACAALSGSPTKFAREREALQENIRSAFWSAKRKAFLDLTPDGGQARRITAATLLPLLWRESPKDISRALAMLPGDDVLYADGGIAQWESRDRDPAPPPIRLETHHILLPILDRLKEEDAAPLSAALHRALSTSGEQASSVLLSALRLRLLPYAHRINPNLVHVPRWVLSLEKHRTGVIGTAATLLFLAPVIGVLWIASGPRLSPLEEHLIITQAQTELSMRRYQEAEELYTTVLENASSDRAFAQYYFRRGNIRFRMEQHDQALQDYRQAIDLDPEGLLHQARWNLAQSYRSLGQVENARTALQAYLNEYGEELPEQADRANIALQLLRP